MLEIRLIVKDLISLVGSQFSKKLNFATTRIRRIELINQKRTKKDVAKNQKKNGDKKLAKKFVFFFLKNTTRKGKQNQNQF